MSTYICRCSLPIDERIQDLHNETCPGDSRLVTKAYRVQQEDLNEYVESMPPKHGFTVKFLNQVNFEDLTPDQCTRILQIILEEK